MSSHSATKIDQKEYLKKYLSGDKVKKKKKDKKRKKDFGAAKVKIIDDDASYNQTQQEFDEELLLGGEDAPQIVGEYVEETANGSSAPKWRSIVVKEEDFDEESEVKVNHISADDLWGPKQIKRKIKDEFSPPRRKTNVDTRQRSPDNSPPRRKRKDSLSMRSPVADERRHGHLTKHDSSYKKTGSPKYSSKRRKEKSPVQSSRKEKQRSPGTVNRSPDQSPPRRNKRTPDQSPPRRNNSTADISPPRRSKHLSDRRKERSQSRDQSPMRKRRDSAGPSPPSRRNRSADRPKHNSANGSPPRKSSRYNKVSARSSSSDQSPPRKNKHKTRKHKRKSRSRSRSTDESPQRRRKRASSSDQSPPRYSNTKKGQKSSRSPTKKSHRHSSDQSPPRRNDGKHSPPRKRLDNGSPIRIKREQVFPDQSPPRRKQEFVKKEPSPSPPPTHSRWSKLERRSSDSPPPTHKPKASKTLDGKRAGLQDAKSLMQETEERRKREDRMYNEMSKELSGRDAEVRVRNTGRKGQRARDAEAEDPEERRRKEEHERKKKEKYDRWGKGLKQVEEHRQRAEAESYEGSKPLARYENDEDLDRYLREQERAEDPMLEYMRKKKKERQKDTGAVAEMPKYEGSYPENRFGIRPGYRWDGVDRSSGFEKRWFDVQNEKRAKQEEAYLYSVEDM
ncbi:BUD13 homolog isoform X1 [Rhagoletis pomonella]|uniref:BUD13 homolog isoform X1 n=1 Tax=Rhagoletis pomonella TaxID=28610 RepID=UPI0017810BAB|nr:BUD13 homolog isoform X1 [Rhagoletis pomonella]